jgi:hypothetical protein
MSMKERPILFSGPMVRALLDGSKTQTRRVCKPMNSWVRQDCREVRMVDGKPFHFLLDATNPMEELRSPYGIPGDRLWVRETWNTSARCLPSIDEPYIYAADLNSDGVKKWAATWRPSIHMPRIASRITLEVTGVRVERLRDISAADCLAEGIPSIDTPGAWSEPIPREPNLPAIYKGAFCALWESINGDESWEANPWVWVVEFKRVVA